MMKSILRTAGVLFAMATPTCAPDEPEHPCDPESGIYNECEKVSPGGGCTDDSQCKWDNSACMGGTCICVPECSGYDCGDDGCGGSCGACGAGESCDHGLCGLWTWTDSKSGLTWQVEPTGGTMTWDAAKTHCSDLDLAGHTDWRLPDIGELRSLIRGCPATELGSATCKVEKGGCLDSTCDEGNLCEYCSGNNGPADGCYWPDSIIGTCGWYRSSSPVEDVAGHAWYVGFDYGDVYDLGVDGSGRHVRCVR